MKKSLTLSLFIILSINTFAQKFELYQGDTINKTDSKNLKQGLWIFFSIDFAGGISQKGNYIDNKKNGTWQTFHQNGKLKSVINYEDNKQSGEVIIYYPNGKIQEKGFWKVNKWVGEYFYYHENGIVKYHWFFNNDGKRTGKQQYFYENGKPQIDGDWVEGKEKGIITEYYTNGNIKKTSNFTDGLLNGSVTEYYADGQLKSKSVYIAGQVDINQNYAYAPTVNNTNNPNENDVNNDIKPDTNKTSEVKFFTGTGYYKFLNEKGQIDREGDFQNGILIEGKRYIYDNGGKLLKIAIIQDGRFVKYE